jgi:hypothetical protein
MVFDWGERNGVALDRMGEQAKLQAEGREPV